MIGHLFKGLFGHYYHLVSGMDELLQRFNWAMAMRKVILIDDVHGATKAQHRKLIARVVAPTMGYEKKGIDMVHMTHWTDYWVTSEQECVFHTAITDRRQVILETSQIRRRDVPFFKKVLKECRNFKVMRAWLEFLKKRDITHFDSEADLATTTMDRVKAMSLPSPVAFLVEIFEEDQWWYKEGDMGSREEAAGYKGHIKFHNTNDGWTIFMTKHWFMTRFQKWNAVRNNMRWMKIKQLLEQHGIKWRTGGARQRFAGEVKSYLEIPPKIVGVTPDVRANWIHVLEAERFERL